MRLYLWPGVASVKCPCGSLRRNSRQEGWSCVQTMPYPMQRSPLRYRLLASGCNHQVHASNSQRSNRAAPSAQQSLHREIAAPHQRTNISEKSKRRAVQVSVAPLKQKAMAPMTIDVISLHNLALPHSAGVRDRRLSLTSLHQYVICARASCKRRGVQQHKMCLIPFTERYRT